MKPGQDIIDQGILDLTNGVETIPALLVLIGAPRLRQAGITIPQSNLTSPEHRLYEILRAENPNAAHSRYNAWIRRLVSFEHAAKCGN